MTYNKLDTIWNVYTVLSDNLTMHKNIVRSQTVVIDELHMEYAKAKNTAHNLFLQVHRLRKGEFGDIDSGIVDFIKNQYYEARNKLHNARFKLKQQSDKQTANKRAVAILAKSVNELLKTLNENK